MAHEYKYFAFISYKSQDRRWANWLQRKLEYYILPAEIRKADTRLSKGIRPVFKDTSDLGAGNLENGIRQALAESRYLIVICSPRAAKSKWVNKEVKEFIDCGRLNDIIPFIIGGIPNSSDPTEECFPEELRNLSDVNEIKGANISEGGRNAAAVRVIARMFNLRFDELWQRFRRREIKRRIIYGCVAALMLVAGILVFDYFQMKTIYYEDFAIRNGMPEGICRLKKSELKRYPAYCKFEYTKRKLVRVTICDYHGRPVSQNTNKVLGDDPIMEMGYENGRFNSILHKDVNGKPVYKELYVSDDFTKVDLKDSASGDAARLFSSGTSMTESFSQENIDPMSIFSKGKSAVGRYVYDYDDEGYIVRKMFKRYNGSNEPGFDSNGISGFAFTYDSNHRISSITYLDSECNPYPNKYGVIREEVGYDSNGIAKERRFLGPDGNLKINEMGYALETQLWEADIPRMITSYYDENGKPTISKSLIHKTITTMTKSAVVTEVFGKDGKPTLFYNPLNYKVGFFYKVIMEYSDQGRLAAASFYDIDGNPGYCGLKIHKIRYYYSTNALPDSCISYDINGERKNSIDNYSKIVFTYDDNGNRTSESYHDYRNRPVYINGVQYLSAKFENGKPVKISGFSHNMWPVPMNVYGGAYSVDIDYDSDGNAEEMRFLDSSGNLYNTPGFGFAKSKATYMNGNLTKISSYDENGNLTGGNAGFAEHRFEWNKNGNLTKSELFDSEQKSICDMSGVARYEYEYDMSGNCIEIRTYDSEGKLTVCNNGYAICKNEYADNRIISMRAFGTDGLPMLSPAKVHMTAYTYDNVGRPTSEKYFDTAGNATLCIHGYHGQLIDYDRFGNNAKITFIGTEGNLVNTMENYAVQRNFFDNKNNNIKIEYLDADLNLAVCKTLGYAYSSAQYDNSGFQVEIAFYNADSKPTNSLLGYHKAMSKFNDDGLPLMYYTLDADGSYVDTYINNTYASKLVNIFNDNGEQICCALFNKEENLMFISAYYIEDGVAKGLLTRQFHYGNATMQYPDGTTELYDYDMFYGLDQNHTDEEIKAHKYQHYLDSIGELARHLYDNQ